MEDSIIYSAAGAGSSGAGAASPSGARAASPSDAGAASPPSSGLASSPPSAAASAWAASGAAASASGSPRGASGASSAPPVSTASVWGWLIGTSQERGRQRRGKGKILAKIGNCVEKKVAHHGPSGDCELFCLPKWRDIKTFEAERLLELRHANLAIAVLVQAVEDLLDSRPA
jgi:hypothetical protein